MNPELVIAALLSQAGVTAVIGTRKALGQLPQSIAYPALVYQIISAVPQPNLAANGSQLCMARIQLNPWASTIAEVKEIHAAIRTAIDFKRQAVFSGKLVVSCRVESMDGVEKDNEAGLWTQSVDYMLYYYE